MIQEQEFSEFMIRLIADRNFNFYAHLLFNFEINYSEKVPTAGVYYKNGKYHLDINKDFFHSLNELDKVLLIRHEVGHIIFQHISRGKELDHKLFNISGDIVINDSIFKGNKDSKIEQFGITSNTFDLPKGLNAEQYYNLLQEKQEQNDKKLQQALDSMESDILESDELTESDEVFLKEMLKRAEQRTKGNIPGEISLAMEILFRPAIVDWRSELRDITGNKKMFFEYTRKRLSRRFSGRPEIPGRNKSQGFNVIAVVDVSGSMGDEDICNGLSEIKEICDFTRSSMFLCQIDTKAYDIEEYTGQTEFKRKGQGGTHLEYAIDKIYEEGLECDCICLITDGYTGKEEKFSLLDIPVMILSTTGQCDMLIGDNMKVFNLSVKS